MSTTIFTRDFKTPLARGAINSLMDITVMSFPMTTIESETTTDYRLMLQFVEPQYILTIYLVVGGLAFLLNFAILSILIMERINTTNVTEFLLINQVVIYTLIIRMCVIQQKHNNRSSH